jgi:hypothetical protein
MLKRGLTLVGLVVLLSLHSFAAQYVVTLQNDQLTTGSTYEFDVYIQSLSGSLNLNFYQLILTYNTAIGGAGTLTFRYIDGTCEINTLPTAYVDILPDGDALKLAVFSQASGSTITTSPARIGRFRISNTTAFAIQAANIDWSFSGNSGGTIVVIDLANATSNGTFDKLLGNAPLPIQLTSFAASVVMDNDVQVAWKTVSETNNYGFEIYRKRGEPGEWTKIAFVEGHGTTLAAQSYSYTDKSVGFGKYSYQIKQIDLDGKSKAFPEVDVTVGIGSGTFIVGQNYPNPFNPSTTIEFAVPQTGRATMKVYNILGQEVATLFDGNAETAKIYTVNFNGSDLASGLYFYTLSSAGRMQTKRMLMMK